MASPKWSSAKEAPIAASISAAVCEAWNGPEEGASNRFAEALRKMVGPDEFERIELAVRCAACGAPAGEPCRDLSDTWLLDGRSHQGRIWQLEAWRNHWAAGGQPEQARPRVSVVVQGDLFAEVPSG